MVIAYLAAVSAIAAAPSCEHLNPSEVDRLADSVESALIYPDKALGRLHEYWGSVCEGERAGAPPSVVVRLAKLLSFRDARFAIASALADVGPNLVAAKPFVDAAVTDERLRYDELTKKEPVVFNAKIYYDAVMCVERKIETGTVDARYCRGILAAESD